MSDIEWTDETWNPTRGCSRVSAGCDHCYAISFAHRFSGPAVQDPSGDRSLDKPAGRYHGLTVLRPKTAKRPGVDWSGRVVLVEDMIERPLSWRKPRRIFVNSMSDLFHDALDDADIDRVFEVMGGADDQGLGHTFQVLTKRAARARDYLRSERARKAWNARRMNRSSWPASNVWLGVSVENQAAANERIPLLLDTPAAVRFLSCEPLLEELNLHPWLCAHGNAERPEQRFANICRPRGDIHWVIVGGESGPGAREFDLDWARSLVVQCWKANVPCFVKQLGAKPLDGESDAEECRVPLKLRDRKGGDMSEWPPELRVREFPR